MSTEADHGARASIPQEMRCGQDGRAPSAGARASIPQEKPCGQDGRAPSAGARASSPQEQPCGQDGRAPSAGARASSPQAHKGCHSRGYLPHIDAAQLTQFVTFRLADAVPTDLIKRWQEELSWSVSDSSEDAARAALHRQIDQYVDAGHGACQLRDPQAASIVQQALLHFDGVRYRLIAWCIMPNHVHVLIELMDDEHSLQSIVHSWKSWSATRVNKHLGRSGALWMPDYFDRYMRDDAQMQASVSYILNNPVKAGLVQSSADWPWCGARV